MTEQYIYHMTLPEDWNRAESKGEYHHPSLDDENFIHCSTKAQTEETANIYFKNSPQLLLLKIDPNKLTAKLQFDHSASRQQDFPHIYGPLNLDAVIDKALLTKDSHGLFTWPDNF